jgi:Fe2+ transport system protein FeoA
VGWPLANPALVSRIKTDNADMLQHILDRGFKIGAVVHVIARDPFDGPLTVEIDSSQQIIGHAVATCVLVEEPQVDA